MLVLTRFLNQQIIITTPNGDLITITLTRSQASKASIGIEAPPTYFVDRSEAFIRNTTSRQQNIKPKTINDYE